MHTENNFLKLLLFYDYRPLNSSAPMNNAQHDDETPVATVDQ